MAINTVPAFGHDFIHDFRPGFKVLRQPAVGLKGVGTRLPYRRPDVVQFGQRKTPAKRGWLMQTLLMAAMALGGTGAARLDARHDYAQADRPVARVSDDYDYECNRPALDDARQTYEAFERLENEEGLTRFLQGFTQHQYQRLLTTTFPEAEARRSAEDQLAMYGLSELENNHCIPDRDQLLPLARLQDQLNTYQTRLDEIEKERATLPPSEAIARRHFEELLGDVPPLDLHDPRLKHQWPQNTYVIAPINQENSVSERWQQLGPDFVNWQVVPRHSGLVEHFVRNLTDGTPQAIDQEYPMLNQRFNHDLTRHNSVSVPSPGGLGWLPWAVPNDTVDVTSTTNVRPVSSVNLPGAGVWDTGQAHPRSVMIVVGSDHAGFTGTGYDWFRRNAEEVRDGLLEAYGRKGLDKHDVVMVWQPTPETLRDGFEQLRRFSEDHCDEGAETMVYV
ncbi:MAG: hypothetical protein KC475_10720, partial [Cyanobacteria bacterium HKST-UBA03]|nr:hypothetical protein [Cyanobacteria bacterium HKST-UBA03]